MIWLHPLLLLSANKAPSYFKQVSYILTPVKIAHCWFNPSLCTYPAILVALACEKVSHHCNTEPMCYTITVSCAYYNAFPHVNVQKLSIHCVSKKGTPTLSIVTLKRINGFWRFLAKVFLKQLAIKWLFNFPPHPTSASTLPGENRTNEMLHFIQGSIITVLK